MVTLTCIKDKSFQFIIDDNCTIHYNYKAGDVINCKISGDFYVFPHGGKLYKLIFVKYFA